MIKENSLLGKILRGYTLDISGIHGLAHWFRVIDYGHMLGRQNGADLNLITLFGLLHDSRRHNESLDQNHGLRAAKYSRNLYREGSLDLPPQEMEILYQACAGHTGGLGHANITVRTCWDADRLDLNRLGWKIDPELLNTKEAQAFINLEKPPLMELLDLDDDLLSNLIEIRKENPLIGVYL